MNGRRARCRTASSGHCSQRGLTEVGIVITKPELAIAVLDLLTDAEVGFAVLHGVDTIASAAAASDVDLAVQRHPMALLAELAPRLRQLDLHPVLRWNYDVEGATTVFLATNDAAEGVQLDLLHDPAGVGRDGLVTQALFRTNLASDPWPRIEPVHELLYLIRKRDRKGDRAALDVLVEAARAVPFAQLELESARIFRAPVARRVCNLVQAWPEPTRRVATPLVPRERFAWLKRRLREPIGFWVELCGPDSADAAMAVATRFRRFLPRVRAEQRPSASLATRPWFLTSVAPVRWRPGLYVSWASDSGHESRVPPDLRIDDPISHGTACTRVVKAMEARVLARADAS